MKEAEISFNIVHSNISLLNQTTPFPSAGCIASPARAGDASSAEEGSGLVHETIATCVLCKNYLYMGVKKIEKSSGYTIIHRKSNQHSHCLPLW